MKPITLNDLPKYSSWPTRLLSLSDWKQRKKTPEDLWREYETESWGVYLKKVQDQGLEESITTALCDSWQGDNESLIGFSQNGKFFEEIFESAYQKYVDIHHNYLSSCLPADCIVELGAGYGSIIIKMAHSEIFKGVQLKAGEYMPSGVELLKLCARNEGISIEAGHCDFLKFPVAEFDIPKNSVVFTSTAVSTHPKLDTIILENLLLLEPKKVVFFEPLYEHFQGQNLISHMRKRYVEINDYNTNLLTIVREFEKLGKLKIVTEEEDAIGLNPFFPISILAIEPA